MPEPISVDIFRELFAADNEFAVIDPRQADAFAQGHILAAANLPLALLGERIRIVVPQQQTPCVLCDAGAGEALEAAALLESLGYTQVQILEGGLQAWQDSGGAVFSGVSVPGKAFGEYIEHACATPAMTAAELQARRQAGAKVLLLDVRTEAEHSSYCIPGAILCPGAELVYRVPPVIEPAGGSTTMASYEKASLSDAVSPPLKTWTSASPGWPGGVRMTKRRESTNS